MDRLEPVYRLKGDKSHWSDGTITYETNDRALRIPRANGYRLPAEAEWEWAARGGRNSQGYMFAGSNNLNAVGWYAGNSGGGAHEVGEKAANELGIHDRMTGDAGFTERP